MGLTPHSVITHGTCSVRHRVCCCASIHLLSLRHIFDPPRIALVGQMCLPWIKLIETIGNSFLLTQGEPKRSFTKTQGLDWDKLALANGRWWKWLRGPFAMDNCVPWCDKHYCETKLTQVVRLVHMNTTIDEEDIKWNNLTSKCLQVQTCKHFFKPQKHSTYILAYPKCPYVEYGRHMPRLRSV